MFKKFDLKAWIAFKVLLFEVVSEGAQLYEILQERRRMLTSTWCFLGNAKIHADHANLSVAAEPLSRADGHGCRLGFPR